jgi:hypothetical protein
MPALTVKLDERDLAMTQEKLRPELVTEPAAELVAQASAFAVREAREGARELGGIPASLVAEGRGLEAKVVSRHPGAVPMELGRRPGAAMPPPDALERYGHGLGIVIARAIARRGIRGRFFVRNARTKLRNTELPRLIEQAQRRIRARWGAR